MKKYYVYIHLKADTFQPFYVGKGHGRRAWDKSHRNRFWKFTVKRHGIVVKLLHEGLSETEAFSLEVTTIKLLGLENLCNFTNGGEIGPRGYKHSTETKAKISTTKRKNMNDITKAKIGNAHRGLKHSPETLSKISKAIRGRKLTKEWKQKIGKANWRPVETTCGKKFASAMFAIAWLKTLGYDKADSSSIVKCCKGKISHAYNYRWKYSTAA